MSAQTREPDRYAHTRAAAVLAPLSRALVGALLLFALAACGTGGGGGPAGPSGPDGPNGPDGPGTPLTLLPDAVPVGLDPSGGNVDACSLTGRAFDDDVTVPPDVACAFTEVTI